MVSKALGLWPVAFVGLISYSLYLWHWPLLVFARYYKHPRVERRAGGLGRDSQASCSPVLSWAYVEQPFRRKPDTHARERLLFAGAATAIAVLILGGTLRRAQRRDFLGACSPRRPWPLPAAPKLLTSIRLGKGRANGSRTINPCVAGAQVEPSYALWGDSHAGVMVAAFAEMAERHGESIKVFVANGCPPVFGVHRDGRYAGCYARNNDVMRALEQSREIKSVILMSRYAQYIDGKLRPEDRMISRDDCRRVRRGSRSADAQDRVRTPTKPHSEAADRRGQASHTRLPGSGDRLQRSADVGPAGRDGPRPRQE